MDLKLKMTSQMKPAHKQTTAIFVLVVLSLASFARLTRALDTNQSPPVSSPRPWLRPQLRSAAAASSSRVVPSPQAGAPATPPQATLGQSRAGSLPGATGSAIEVPAAVVLGPARAQVLPLQTAIGNANQNGPSAATAASTNRTTRTADIFQNGDGFNTFITNTCESEREHYLINVKTSRPFFGIIHTRGHRSKAACSVEGTGATDYNLEISQTMNPRDSGYCGALRGARTSPGEPELVNLVLVVRFHKSIELSDDRFYVLNCTNKCLKKDCSQPSAEKSGNIEDRPESEVSPDAEKAQPEECTIYRFPWAVALLWCLGITTLALMISHCVLCSSFVCRYVKKEVEEQEPSLYEEDGSEFAGANKKQHPFRIEYDNRDYYKTSNNYQPYTLNDHQQQEVSCDEDSDQQEQRSKRTHHKKHHHSRAHSRHRN